jgi:membrane protease YdiL (CAAX protease family)
MKTAFEIRPEDPPNSDLPEPARPTPRIPNLGHAAVFVLTAVILLSLFQLLLMLLGDTPGRTHAGATSLQHPKLQILVMFATYFLTLGGSWLLFPMLWRRSLLEGIRWNWFVARSQAPKLIGLGLLLGVMMQLITYFITAPKSIPIDEFFVTPADAWLITFFGIFVAPVFEEICFRGFLLPAFAIAYDWLSLPRTEAAREHWQTTTTLSPAGLLFSAILTSIFFAMLHFQQVAHLWAATLVLFSISLVLTLVRVRTQSVAASAMVHAAYNGFVFIAVLIATGGYRHLDRMTH